MPSENTQIFNILKNITEILEDEKIKKSEVKLFKQQINLIFKQKLPSVKCNKTSPVKVVKGFSVKLPPQSA
jgi:hypothetical protein